MVGGKLQLLTYCGTSLIHTAVPTYFCSLCDLDTILANNCASSRIASGLILRAELRLELIVDSSSKAASISHGRFGGHLNGRTNHLRILNPSN